MKKRLLSLLLLLTLTPVLFAQFGDRSGSSSSSDMMALNIISVTIGGNFPVSGSFAASATERVDQFITRMYNEIKIAQLTATQDLKGLEELAYPERDIILRRFDGTEIKIDLAKFRLTGDFANNPYLKNNDVIIFPQLDNSRNFVEISGAINFRKRKESVELTSVKFQFVEGDKLSDAILFSGGINQAYENVTEAEISRLSYDGNKEEKLVVKIADDFLLKRGDRIRILANESNRKNYYVTIDGEVNSPGIIYITKENTTIAEVIRKAGGFKENADLNRAELVRGTNVFGSLYFSQEFEELMMTRMAELIDEDSVYFKIDNQLRFARGNGIIEFEKVMDENSEDSKFIVKNGDYINIPEKLNMVYVFGQVVTPGYVEYSKNADFNYYLAKAGGIGETAKEEMYLIKGKTRTWIEIEEDKQLDIEPGDFIWIPKEPVRNFDFYLNRIGNIAQIVGGVATVIVLLIQLGK